VRETHWQAEGYAGKGGRTTHVASSDVSMANLPEARRRESSRIAEGGWKG
jgi:hypothetical protein